MRLRERDEQPYTESGAALVGVWAAEVPRSTGDVEMCPGGVADKAAQELRGRDRAGLASLGCIVEVGVLALDEFGEFGMQR